MDKTIFNNVQNMIEKELVNEFKNSSMSLTELCHTYGCTVSEYHEYLDLALLGFKEKYNQHNHPENNKGVNE